jgi:hypothetical protein
MNTTEGTTMTRYLIDWKYGAQEGGMDAMAKNEASARSMLFAELRKSGVISSPLNIYDVKIIVREIP